MSPLGSSPSSHDDLGCVMVFRRRSRFELKTDAQFAMMRVAGLVVAETLAEVTAAVAPGVTTEDLDRVAEAAIRSRGATPSFLGYHGYPATICVSVNDEVVHGIPGSRVLRDGDLVSIDCGAIVDGWHGDSAVTVAVGTVSPELEGLSTVTERSMWAGLAAARPGARLGDIGHAIETLIRAAGPYGIVEEYVGHGIGTSMHMDPPVPNLGRPGEGSRLEVGMALAIEPMVVLGSPDVDVLDDGWTVVATGVAAHWEHTVAITEAGPWVLTALEDVRL